MEAKKKEDVVVGGDVACGGLTVEEEAELTRILSEGDDEMDGLSHLARLSGDIDAINSVMDTIETRGDMLEQQLGSILSVLRAQRNAEGSAEGEVALSALEISSFSSETQQTATSSSTTSVSSSISATVTATSTSQGHAKQVAPANELGTDHDADRAPNDNNDKDESTTNPADAGMVAADLLKAMQDSYSLVEALKLAKASIGKLSDQVAEPVPELDVQQQGGEHDSPATEK